MFGLCTFSCCRIYREILTRYFCWIYWLLDYYNITLPDLGTLKLRNCYQAKIVKSSPFNRWFCMNFCLFQLLCPSFLLWYLNLNKSYCIGFLHFLCLQACMISSISNWSHEGFSEWCSLLCQGEFWEGAHCRVTALWLVMSLVVLARCLS